MVILPVLKYPMVATSMSRLQTALPQCPPSSLWLLLASRPPLLCNRGIIVKYIHACIQSLPRHGLKLQANSAGGESTGRAGEEAAPLRDGKHNHHPILIPPTPSLTAQTFTSRSPPLFCRGLRLPGLRQRIKQTAPPRRGQLMMFAPRSLGHHADSPKI